MNICRLCGRQQLLTLFNMGNHPIAHHFLTNPSQEEYVHPVHLCFCEDCGLVQLINPAPPGLLYKNYICLSSWKYQPHIPRLIKMVEGTIDFNKTSNILEVGSNDGRFLSELSKLGYQRITGIEPANDAQESAEQKGIKTIQSSFNCKVAEEFVASYGKCDLFISRQMLEHVQDLKEFIEAMKIAIKPGGFVLFEVPNFECNLDNFDYTIWEEHVNYFTMHTLKRFLFEVGIKILHSETIIFSGDNLVIIGKYVGNILSEPQMDYTDILKEKVFIYKKQWPTFCSEFIGYLSEHKGKIVIYGAGARICSLINFVGLGKYIEFIVDDQVEKQYKYMPGSNLSILPAKALEEHLINLCLLAVNAECEDMVISKHPDFVKRGGAFVSVLPPSNRLPDFWNRIKQAKMVQKSA